MYLNKVFLSGNLTRDPELRALPSGVQVVTFGLATNRVWRDKDGNKKENTEFHNIVVFGRQAELCAQYLNKGRSALIEGRIQTRSWDDAQTGQKKYRTEIVAESVQFGPAPVSSSRNGTQHQSGVEQKEVGGEGSGNQNTPSIEYPEEDINPEDIPF